MTALVLVGLMGAGKSTVGQAVAARTGRRMVDSDTTVEAATGKTVRELWEAGGEESYRAFESQVVLAALNAPDDVVVAAPGGAVLDPAVREALGDAFVVWLRADPTVLAGRVKPGDHRPLLGDRPVQVLTQMAADRAALYGEVADVVIDIADRDVDAVVTLVLNAMQGHESAERARECKPTGRSDPAHRPRR